MLNSGTDFAATLQSNVSDMQTTQKQFAGSLTSFPKTTSGFTNFNSPTRTSREAELYRSPPSNSNNTSKGPFYAGFGLGQGGRVLAQPSMKHMDTSNDETELRREAAYERDVQSISSDSQDFGAGQIGQLTGNKTITKEDVQTLRSACHVRSPTPDSSAKKR